MKRDEISTPYPGHQKASASITAAMSTVNFPVTKAELIRQVGSWKVPVGDASVLLSSILEAVPADRFGDVASAARAVDAHWGRIADTLKAAVSHQNRQNRKPYTPENTE